MDFICKSITCFIMHLEMCNYQDKLHMMHVKFGMFFSILGRKVSLNIYSLLVTSESHCALSELDFHFYYVWSCELGCDEGLA